MAKPKDPTYVREHVPEQVRTRALTRSAKVAGFNKEARTVELSFSSETDTVERWFGIEILSHEPGAMDMSRLNDGGALLLQHDHDDQIGVVESATVGEDRRGRAVVRFGRSARAEEIFQDVLDGIRKNVSVGYWANEMKLTEERGDVDVWTVTRWTPYEISIVAAGADATVGIGRSAEPATETPPEPPAVEVAQERAPEPAPAVPTPQEPTLRSKKLTEEEIRAAAAKAALDNERARVAAINKIGATYGADELARQFASNPEGTSEGLQAAILERNAKKSTHVSQSAEIGLTDSEARQFSFIKAIRALANPNDKRAQADAAFEIEASNAAARATGKTPSGILVPQDVLTRALSQTGVGATGSNLVATNLLSSSFIDMLYNRCLLLSKGTKLTGLVGNVDIPKKIAKGTGYWVGEGQDVGEALAGFDKIDLNPKTVGAYSIVTRSMLQQATPDAEGLMRADIAQSLGQTIDTAGWYGQGAHQPTGILHTAGITTVDFAGVEPTYAELVAMESALAAANADIGTMGYVMHTRTKGALKTTQTFPGTANGTPVWNKNEINGYGAEATNQLAHGDVVFANFADFLVAMWGGLELTVDPITFVRSGGLQIVALQSIDFGVRHGASFAYGRKAP